MGREDSKVKMEYGDRVYGKMAKEFNECCWYDIRVKYFFLFTYITFTFRFMLNYLFDNLF